jgi:hypothetical protein
MEENWAAAAERAKQPLMNGWGKVARTGPAAIAGSGRCVSVWLDEGRDSGIRLRRERKEVSITDASNKFKQLWENGFLLRREATAESGGVEFVYVPIR